jgi:hypothetical protein
MTRRTLRWLVIAGLLGSSSAVSGLPVSRAEAATEAADQYAPGTPGLAGHVVVQSASSSMSSAARPRGARSTRSGTGAAATRTGQAPTATAQATASASGLLHNFNGVSSLDSAVTNFGAEFEPPDQGLCAGNGFVLEPVNSAYRIYRTTGNSLRGPFNINDLFNVGGKEFTSDPRCWFDPRTQTWFATILFLNDSSTASSLLIAVRHNSDPRGLWNEYSIDTTDPSGNGCPCFGDQPRIGIDQTNLYVTADEFSILGPQFNGAEMWVIDKSDLVNGVVSPHVVNFPHLTTDTVAPQPALSTGKPGAEYFLSSLDPSGTGDNRIGVWAMTNRDQVGLGGTPDLSSVVIKSEAYAIPPPAPQKGAKSKLDSGDDRMQQTEFVGSTVWGELTTAVQPAGDSSVRAGGAWFQVKPTLGSGGIAGASIVRQGYIAAAGKYEIYPAVQPDAAGNAAVVFTLTSSARFPSAAYATLKAGGSNFGPAVVAASGAGPYDPNATRWGDYSFAVPDDTSDSAWLATEYIPPKSSQTTTGIRNWGTRVIKVPLG